MNPNKFEKYKQFIQRYISLDQMEWELLTSKMKILRYKKGEIIHHIDDVCNKLMFINNGLARAYTIDENGKDYTFLLYFNDKNSHMVNLFTVDYESLVNQTPSRLKIEAVEDCEFVSTNVEDKQFLYNNSKKYERFGRLMNQEAYTYTHHKILDFQSKNAKERFEDFMQQTPFLLDKLPQHQIATYLGVTPVHMSRLKKECL